ncbi:cyclin-dependent kinase inhibitor 1C-like [Phyllostomus hastatus]|uniref:cyclin-dependent kinase inhibitor 1C-like n=1 Tax=Phyllostomus hastatus TaxID=9423 RepID=UPI001E681A2F|nr:cyclin-dependent kinase inhibitor 1C-like [Phyllostomus hastatus]
MSVPQRRWAHAGPPAVPRKPPAAPGRWARRRPPRPSPGLGRPSRAVLPVSSQATPTGPLPAPILHMAVSSALPRQVSETGLAFQLHQCIQQFERNANSARMTREEGRGGAALPRMELGNTVRLAFREAPVQQAAEDVPASAQSLEVQPGVPALDASPRHRPRPSWGTPIQPSVRI